MSSFKTEFTCRYKYYLATAFQPDLMRVFIADFECNSEGAYEISIYPNPVDNQSYLQLNNMKLIRGIVRGYDAIGSLMNEEPAEYMT